jgi:mRNA interferase RelE/StbE
MSWTIIYHQDIEDDLTSVGPSAARRIMRAIDTKLITEPLQFGVPLSANLTGFRKLRIGDYRAVYQVVEAKVMIFVLAVGPRRNKEIYKIATKRII